MALVPFASVDLSALRWLRSAESPPGYVLLSGDQPLAELSWTKASGSLATAGVSDRRWTLKRAGFLTPHLTLRVEGAPNETARITVHPDLVGIHVGDSYHRIDFAGGSKFRFFRAGVQLPAWKIQTDEKVEVAHIEPVREGRTLRGAAVLVTPEGRAHSELAAVLVFAWYFIVLAWFQDEMLRPFEELLSDLEQR